MTNKFAIKINKDKDGRDLSLASMSIGAADALKVFIESITEFVKHQKNASDLHLSLKDGCIEAALSYPKIGNSIEEDIQNILDGKSENNSQIRLMRAIQNKVKANGLDCSIYHSDNNQTDDATDKFKAKNFPYKRSPKVESHEQVIILNGKLFESGGKVKTNVHLEVGNVEYKVDCTREQAKTLNELLYEDVNLCVLKKWKTGFKEKYQYLDSYLNDDEFIEYKSFYESLSDIESLERFDVLHNKLVDITNDAKDSCGGLIKIMKLFNHSQSDRGLVRTVLMTLKPIKSKDEGLLNMHQNLADILRAGSTNNII